MDHTLEKTLVVQSFTENLRILVLTLNHNKELILIAKKKTIATPSEVLFLGNYPFKKVQVGEEQSAKNFNYVLKFFWREALQSFHKLASSSVFRF